MNIGSPAISSGKFELAGYTLHRALIINALVMIPLSLILYNFEHVLIALGIEPTIVPYTVSYALYLIPRQLVVLPLTLYIYSFRIT